MNKALDLGLALEVALMAGNQTQTTEINNKLGIRAGWLIGDTPEKRLSAYKTAGHLYSARSAAAHQGELNERVLKTYNFHESNTLVQEILVSLLHRGDFPDWTKLSLGISEGDERQGDE